MRVLDTGIAARHQPGTDRQSCAFPSICVIPGGRWLCAFRGAPSKTGTTGQRVWLTWSDDQGQSWSEPVAPFQPPSVDGRPGLFRGAYLTALGGPRVLAAVYWVDHSRPERPFFNEATEGLLDSRIFLATSEDSGVCWSVPQLVNTDPFRTPTPLTGPVLVLPEGDLALQFELNKHYDDPAPWRHGSVLMFSRDGGRTWPEHTLVSGGDAGRVFYWDQRPGVLADGSLLDVFWTYDRERSDYLNIHARESVDGGRTWSDFWDTGLPDQPAAPVSLPDGRTALVYVDRTAAPVIKARTSDDRGRTWPSRDECVVYDPGCNLQTVAKSSMQDAWSEMGRFSVGLPATTLTENGDVLVVYYAGSDTDRTDVRWARVAG